MPDREIIHSALDATAFLRIACGLGLIIRVDGPTDDPVADIADDARIETLDRGVFSLYWQEWIYGKLQFRKIHGGYNDGKYFQSPRTNISPITAYFGGERLDGDVRRLGGGVISWHTTWYDASMHTERPTPPEVSAAYKKLLLAVDTSVVLTGGVHKYLVLEDALAQLKAGAARPPFDYIEWPAWEDRG